MNILRTARKCIRYIDTMDYICTNPNCKSGYLVEGHHILPLKLGGKDKYINIISLCNKCHRQDNLHENPSEAQQIELLTWKFYLEMTLFGFTSQDVEDRKFIRKANQAKHSKQVF